MFIDAIKAVLSDSPESKVWRFRHDQGEHRNISVVHANPAEQEIVRGAIRLALFGVREKRLKGALVQLSDASGESWIFDRQGDQFRCFRNRQLFDTRIENCLTELFKDYLPAGSMDAQSVFACVKEFDIRCQDDSLIASAQSRRGQRLSIWEQTSTDRLKEHRKKLGDVFGAEGALSVQELQEVLTFGDGMSRRLHALQLQNRDIEKFFVQMSHFDIELIGKLEQELQLIQKIATIAEPWSDPSMNPRLLHDRLRETEEELQQIAESCEMKKLPDVQTDGDWGQALQVLTHFLAYDKLEKAARKTMQEAKQNFKPIFEEYRKSIGDFLQNDKQLIRQLEDSLNDLNTQVQLAASDQEKNRENLSSKLNKLLGLSHLDGGQNRNDNAGGFGPQNLDQARQAVNECLQSIGRLYGELSKNEDVHEQNFAELEQRYEKILAEYGKVRAEWLAMSERLGLAPDMSVRALVQWLGQQSKAASLQQKKARIHEALLEFRNQNKMLVHLLEAWRTHTGSQKPGSPEPALALTEARTVLQYAEKKREQLHKLRSIESQYEAYRNMKAKVEAEIGLLQSRWAKASTTWSLAGKNLEPGMWEEIAQTGREVLVLERLFETVNSPIKDSAIFSPAALDAPLTMYYCQDEKLSNRARLHFLQQVEQADDCGLGLIFTEDRGLYELLCKLGLCRAQKQEPKLEAVATTGSRDGKSLVSDRARSALEVFAGRQTTLPRSSF